MDDETLAYLPAREIAQLIANGDLSAVEVMDATIRRAERLQPALNFIAVERYEKAREESRAAASLVAARQPLGPLHGVPITIKDNIATQGDLLTNGSHAFENVVPVASATLAARLKAAGAIVFAKTTLPELAHKMLTDSPRYGITRNPWSLTHTPGGSSGGASAAVAAGLGPIAIGTEGGGSIRCPASCAGLLGIKATLGRIPGEFFPEGFANFAFCGPLARDVSDLTLAVSVMSGEEPRDPHTLGIGPMATPPFSTAVPDLRSMRIGWMPTFGRYQPDAAVAALTEASVRGLQTDGAASVEEVRTHIFDDVFDYYVVIATASRASGVPPLLERFGNRMSDSIKDMVRQGSTYSAVQWQQASDRRTALFRDVQALLQQYDVLAMPTLMAPPKLVDAGGVMNSAMYAQWCAPLYAFNLTGHPALSVPAGWTSDGLPVGIQFVGRWYDEPRLLQIARWLELSRPWAQRRPKV